MSIRRIRSAIKELKRITFPCEYCDAFLDGDEKFVTVYRHRAASHFIFERVPAQVCSRCGERYFSAKVVREMDRLMQEQPPHSSTVSVPLIEFTLAA